MIVAASLVLALSGAANAAEVAVASDGHAFNPSWSPDGQWLAFELNKYEGNVDLYVVKVQNGNPVGTPQKVDVPGATSSFSTGGSVAAAPTWHPQGMLIFEGSSAGGTNRLYYWAPGGQKASQLLATSQISGDLSWPAVSPDGKIMAFVSDATGNGDLYYWDRGTNEVKQASATQFSEMAPRYASDGQRLAYSRKNRGGEDIFVWQGGTSSPLVGGNGDQSRPIWAGETVVFFSNERGEDHWDIAASAGAGAKTVIALDVRLPLRSTPTVVPGNQWVAFGSATPEQAHQITLVSLDGQKTIPIDTGFVACGEPAIVTANGRTYMAYTALPSDSADWRQLQILDITDKL